MEQPLGLGTNSDQAPAGKHYDFITFTRANCGNPRDALTCHDAWGRRDAQPLPSGTLQLEYERKDLIPPTWGCLLVD